MSLPPVFTNRCCKLVSDQFSIYRDCPRKTPCCSVHDVGAFSQAGRRGFESRLPLQKTFRICTLGAIPPLGRIVVTPQDSIRWFVWHAAFDRDRHTGDARLAVIGQPWIFALFLTLRW